MLSPSARTFVGLRRRRHSLLLLLVAGAGALLFINGLGQTGLVDETPALFAASARQMARSGDWLIPHVNGLPRYDKPPLVYWFMASLYSLPGESWWDPLGTWAARLPSALATIITMVLLADTLLRWPQTDGVHSRRGNRSGMAAALGSSFSFALSPLVLVWGRTEVSDALFMATLAFSLLLAWRSYAAERGAWWPSWVALGLAVLTKGPVALVLFALTWLLFWLLGASAARIRMRLRPLPGIALTLALSIPWYGLALWREGQPYWESFFGYHNLQRYTRVVNNHSQGWWFFLAMLLLGSLPFTPLLLLSLGRTLRQARSLLKPRDSLARFASAWVLAVLLFFSASATKLPSYWLVATPAAGVLVALVLQPGCKGSVTGPRRALALSAVLLLILAAALAASPLWLSEIQDPTLPGLQGAFTRTPALTLGAGIMVVSALLFRGVGSPPLSWRLVQGQAVLMLLGPLMLQPVWTIGDQLRGSSLRHLAAIAKVARDEQETLAMVGRRQPSLHYYSDATVIFEGRSPTALVNLADRLQNEQRPGLSPGSQHATVLLVIDSETASQPHWQDWKGMELATAGGYRLWRLDRAWLVRRSAILQRRGVDPNWQDPRPERF
ncbi:MAG: glycosyltransferase family 39 protein [Cyanobacteriota bacterium]|nr:glycosyltransferase family 39 protein [Cyanobacteriota bacterium]